MYAIPPRLHGCFGTGGYTTTSLMGQVGPFARTSTTVRGMTEHPNLPMGMFGTFWALVLVAAMIFLWRRDPSAPCGQPGLMAGFSSNISAKSPVYCRRWDCRRHSASR